LIVHWLHSGVQYRHRAKLASGRSPRSPEPRDVFTGCRETARRICGGWAHLPSWRWTPIGTFDR